MRRPRSSATTISKCTSARRKGCTSTPINGSTCSGSTIRRKQPDVTAVTNGTTEWQMRNQFRAWSKFMTHVDVTGAIVQRTHRPATDRFRHPRDAADRPASLRGMARPVRRGRLLLDAARMGPDRSAADDVADVRGQAAAQDPRSSGSRATGPSRRSPRAAATTSCRRRRSTSATKRRTNTSPGRRCTMSRRVSTSSTSTPPGRPTRLPMVDGALKIKLKRVDIVNCDAAFGNIQLFM